MVHRKKLFVDPKVQRALVLRVVGYWFFCLLTMATALLALRLYYGQARFLDWNMADFWHWYGPAAATSLVLLILVVVDTVRMSNRFVGPLVRLRREMRHLAAGEAAKTVHFRVGDFWQEFADEFNAVAQRMELLEAQASRERTAAATATEPDLTDKEYSTWLAANPAAPATSLTIGGEGDLEDDLSHDLPRAAR